MAISASASRLPVKGIAAAIAETFNDIVEFNRRTSRELRRISRARRPLRPVQSPRLDRRQRRPGRGIRRPSTSSSRSSPSRARGQPRAGRRRPRRPVPAHGLEIDGRPLRGEFRRSREIVNTMVDQLNAFASEVTRVAREVGTEGKLGGQADVARRRRHLEGPHRLGELDGRQPHRPGPQHRRGHDRRRAGRPVEEDHGRRPRRDPRAEGHDQHHGRPAQRASPPR